MLYGPLRPTPSTFAALGFALVGALILRFFGRQNCGPRRRLQTLALAAGAGCLMALLTLLLALEQLATRWSPQDAGVRVIAEATVDSLPQRREGALEFDAVLRIEAPRTLQRVLRARIVWHGPAVPPRAGERWRLLLRVTAPQPNSNPGGFDEQREYFRDRLQARAVVVGSSLNRLLARPPPSLLVLRETLAERVRESVIDRDAAALFAGLAVGATGAVSREQWRTFSVTGTTHLVAISGMHVTLFCWLVAAAARASWRRSGRLAARIERDVFAAALGVAAALGYALLAGFGIPTQRTVVMLAVWWALRIGGRVQGPFDALGIALVAVLLIDPFAPLAAGFWLSFVAMATLITLGEPRRRGVFGWMIDNLCAQWWIGLALLPLTLLWFSSIPLAGFVVNLLAIPVFSFVLVPVALLGSALGGVSAALSRPVWWVGERVHDWLWPALVAVANSPYANIETAIAQRWSPMRLVRPAVGDVPQTGEVMVTLLDAGDGAAFIVRTRSRVIVYGTGEQFASEGRGAERLVVPALRMFGTQRVDLLVLGRSHAQHAAGAAHLHVALPVTRTLSGGSWPGAHWPIDDCTQTQRWQWDGVEFSTFGTVGGSCVLRAGFAAGPALLIPERVDAVEAAVLAERAAAGDVALRSTLVVAPRRGSRAALGGNFVDEVAAQWVLLTGRDASHARRVQVAAAWRVEPQRVVAMAERGAVTVHLRAGLPPRWLYHADLQGDPLWRYHPGRTSRLADAMQDPPRP